MLSPTAIVRLLLSLVLITVFSSGSNELRIAVGTIFVWALGLIIHHHLSLSHTFLKYHYCFIVVSCWLLAAYNEIFFENVFGRFFDLFFVRDSFAPNTAGSGFTNWHETLLRRHRDDLAFAWHFLVFAFWTGVAFVSLPFVVGLAALAQQTKGLERAIAHVDKTGEHPPWMANVPPTPPPASDTRYLQLADDMIFVCGPGGGFERVVASDYESAIARRRGFSKRFA
ncbi:hypothetical protein FB567DRAFT_330546 [Paraphoma chrysanthemicola]|uniref:Uncharacterized protein n=1 Tax=Paraphoma chrysanthemicola TaxID=798071 RepID=A0A8K0VYW3_9PLEO|nr:hypothetical protein FB567DRAFT_330546 [Paraphoma chrysanthemicola]